MDLHFLLLHEEKLIQKEVDLNSEADLNGFENGIAYKVHSNLINNLVVNFLISKGISKKTFLENFESVSEFKDIPLIEGLNTEEIPLLCEELHISFLNSKFEYKKGKFVRAKSKSNLIERGAVYTKSNIAKEIVETTIANYATHNPNLNDVKVLDFACGTGRFYENIVDVLYSKYGIPINDIILEHAFAVDIDPTAINITRLKAISMLEGITEKNVVQVSQNILLRNALVLGGMFSEDGALGDDDFRGLHGGKFDIVVSNPPYLVLKINRNKNHGELLERIKRQAAYFRNSGVFYYSIEGMLNYYQLSIEAILTMVKTDGEIGIICPSSLFADISATKLRKHLLLDHKVRKIKYFAEKEQLFENVTQATNIFYLQKAGVTDSIEIEDAVTKFNLNLSLVKKLFPAQMEIPFITEIEWGVLGKIETKKKLKQLSFVRNRRGELDLTLNKDHITSKRTPYRLVRGNMISETGINDINNEFVSETFLQAKSSDFVKNDFNRRRLICQQVSNVGLRKRLKFVFCNETDILGNSCNYLSGDESILQKLSLVLNSGLLNWRFKITSSNNHINNYELDELPIVDLHLVDENYSYRSQKELDEYIGKIYGLENDELQFILHR